MQYCFRIDSCWYYSSNIEELPKDIPKEVIDRLKGFVSLQHDNDIAQWHEFCKNIIYDSVRSKSYEYSFNKLLIILLICSLILILVISDWYTQKLSHLWYLPSVNRFLSLMTDESGILTPCHTNIVETAHAARNEDTGIKRPLLSAINKYEISYWIDVQH